MSSSSGMTTGSSSASGTRIRLRSRRSRSTHAPGPVSPPSSPDKLLDTLTSNCHRAPSLDSQNLPYPFNSNAAEESPEEDPSDWDLPTSQVIPKAGEIYWPSASPEAIAEVQARLSAAESSSPPSKRAVEHVKTPVMRLRPNRRSGQSLRQRNVSGEAIQTLRSIWQEIQAEGRKIEQEDLLANEIEPSERSTSVDEHVHNGLVDDDDDDDDDMFLLQCSQAVDKTPNHGHRPKSRVHVVNEKEGGVKQDAGDIFSSHNMTSPVKVVKYPKHRENRLKSPPPIIQFPEVTTHVQSGAEDDPFGDDEDSFNDHLSQLDFNSLQGMAKGVSPRTPTSSDPNFKRYRSIEVESPWNNAKSSSSLSSSAKSWTRSSSTPDVPNESMPGGRKVGPHSVRPVYSKEEIERKRLEALKKREQNLKKIQARKT